MDESGEQTHGTPYSADDCYDIQFQADFMRLGIILPGRDCLTIIPGLCWSKFDFVMNYE